MKKTILKALITSGALALSMFSNAQAATEYVLDDKQAITSGNWKNSSRSPNSFKGSYKVSTKNQKSSITWTAELEKSGDYDVYYMLPKGKSVVDSAAKYTVKFAGDKTKVYDVDQTKGNGGEWILLGTHKFSKGKGVVTLASNPSTYTVADAIKFVAK